MKVLNDFETGISIKLAANKYLDEIYMSFISYDTSKVEIDSKVDERISRKISFSQWKAVCGGVAKVSKVALVAFCCMISAFFIACMCITPVRSAFTNAMVAWYGDYITISFAGTNDTVNDVFEVKKPEFIPEGMYLYYEDETTHSYIAQYKDENMKSMGYRALHGNDRSISIDEEYEFWESVSLNRKAEGLLYGRYDGSIVLAWANEGNTYYLVASGLDKDDVIKVAKSIK